MAQGRVSLWGRFLRPFPPSAPPGIATLSWRSWKFSRLGPSKCLTDRASPVGSGQETSAFTALLEIDYPGTPGTTRNGHHCAIFVTNDTSAAGSAGKRGRSPGARPGPPPRAARQDRPLGGRLRWRWLGWRWRPLHGPLGGRQRVKDVWWVLLRSSHISVHARWRGIAAPSVSCCTGQFTN